MQPTVPGRLPWKYCPGPGISLDSEGNISYGASSGINVTANGRMTYLSGAQLLNYLKGISAADISKAEMITSPDASFNAAGNAGIINIVSRKKLATGVAADLRSAISAGKYLMTNQNIALNYNLPQLSLYGSFDTIPLTDLSGGPVVIGCREPMRRSVYAAAPNRVIKYSITPGGPDWSGNFSPGIHLQ